MRTGRQRLRQHPQPRRVFGRTLGDRVCHGSLIVVDMGAHDNTHDLRAASVCVCAHAFGATADAVSSRGAPAGMRCAAQAVVADGLFCHWRRGGAGHCRRLPQEAQAAAAVSAESHISAGVCCRGAPPTRRAARRLARHERAHRVGLQRDYSRQPPVLRRRGANTDEQC